MGRTRRGVNGRSGAWCTQSRGLWQSTQAHGPANTSPMDLDLIRLELGLDRKI